MAATSLSSTPVLPPAGAGIRRPMFDGKVGGAGALTMLALALVLVLSPRGEPLGLVQLAAELGQSKRKSNTAKRAHLGRSLPRTGGPSGEDSVERSLVESPALGPRQAFDSVASSSLGDVSRSNFHGCSDNIKDGWGFFRDFGGVSFNNFFRNQPWEA